MTLTLRKITRTSQHRHETRKLEVGFVSIEDCDSPEILFVFAFDTDLKQIIFEDNSIMFADKFL